MFINAIYLALMKRLDLEYLGSGLHSNSCVLYLNRLRYARYLFKVVSTTLEKYAFYLNWNGISRDAAQYLSENRFPLDNNFNNKKY